MNKPSALPLFIVLAMALAAGPACRPVDPAALTIVLLPEPDNPLVSFRFLVRVGSANDPSGKEGLCRLAWSLLAGGGSRTKPIDEIIRAFYPMAAGLSLSLDKEMAVFSGTIRRDHLESYYGLVRDMLLDPDFREADFARLKAFQIADIGNALAGDPDDFLGREILQRMLYRNHPYGHGEAGTAESAAGLTLNEAKAFYREHFVRGNIIIGLAGGYPLGFPERIASDFKALPAGFTPKIILPAPYRPRAAEFVIAERAAPATDVTLGFPLAVTKADKDYFALWIAGAHFGERHHGLSRLRRKIREERGLNAEDYAAIEHPVPGRNRFPAPGSVRQQQYFSIRIGPVDNANRHFVIRQTLRELKSLVEDGLSEERFELVRAFVLNSIKLYAQTLDERLGWRMDSMAYGYGDFLAEAQAILPKLKRADVNAAIRKYLDPDNVLIAVVTMDAAAFKAELVSDAPSPIRYTDPNRPREILDEDAVIAAYPLHVRSEAVRVVPVDEFFRNHDFPGR
jgi:zinc protease